VNLRAFPAALGIAAACAAGAAAPAAAEQLEKFYGYAYDLANGHYLYTEVHERRVDGDRWLGGTIRYFAPDGELLGSKTLDFSSDPFIPVYRLTLPGEHYAEGITAILPGGVEMEKSRDGHAKTGRVEREADMAGDSGFDSYLRTHFADLCAGRTLHFDFAVAGELDAFRFRAQKLADLQYGGVPAVQMRIEPDSLLRLFAAPLTIVYSKENPHLLDYRGVSNIHDPKTGSAYNVHIIYPPAPPPDAPGSLPPL